jgi:transmembrane sensor
MVDGQDLMRQISRAGPLMDPALSDRDVERLVEGATQRRRRRRARRITFTGATAFALALTLVVLVYRSPDSAQTGLATKHAASNMPVDNRMLRLTDGSTAVALDPSTEMAVAEDTKDRVALVLARGRGRFDVTPRPARTFVVNVGDVTISVLGTLFTVERVADRVGLTVEQGTVRVEWGLGSEILKQGESGWYPPLVMSALSGRTVSRETTNRSLATRSARRSPSLASSHDSSFSPVLAKTEKTEEAESAEQLLAAADNARLSGHPEQGVFLLRKLLRDHRRDARAPLAAFTLGRMLLMELANPTEAAAAFAEARRLSPFGPLAEDALAREVEAFNQAGASALAKARAQDYLRLYPDGRRAAALRMLAGTK